MGYCKNNPNKWGSSMEWFKALEIILNIRKSPNFILFISFPAGQNLFKVRKIAFKQRWDDCYFNVILLTSNRFIDGWVYRRLRLKLIWIGFDHVRRIGQTRVQSQESVVRSVVIVTKLAYFEHVFVRQCTDVGYCRLEVY